MTVALVCFTLGFIVTYAVIQARNAIRTLREWHTNVTTSASNAEMRATSALAEASIFEGSLQGLRRDIIELRSLNARPYDSGAADAAIAQLATRLTKLETQLTAQDLTILDTAERVAHKLQDRRRKRDQIAEEIPAGDHDEIPPTDPNLLLAEARRAYGVMPREQDPAQLQLIRDDATGTNG